MNAASCRPKGRPGTPQGQLSPRELDVLRLIAVGFPNKLAAQKLGLSIKTLEKHRSGIYEFLWPDRFATPDFPEVRTGIGMAREALRRGLVTL